MIVICVVTVVGVAAVCTDEMRRRFAIIPIAGHIAVDIVYSVSSDVAVFFTRWPVDNWEKDTDWKKENAAIVVLHVVVPRVPAVKRLVKWTREVEHVYLSAKFFWSIMSLSFSRLSTTADHHHSSTSLVGVQLVGFRCTWTLMPRDRFWN